MQTTGNHCLLGFRFIPCESTAALSNARCKCGTRSLAVLCSVCDMCCVVRFVSSLLDTQISVVRFFSLVLLTCVVGKMECATIFSEGDCCQKDPATQRIAQLQSRIQEQSDLIALLTEQNERSSVCLDPAESSSRIQKELLQEHERANALDRRFTELADKFEQITQIKDSYKDQVKSLELVLRQNTERQHEAVRPMIQAKDDQIDNLKKRVCILERERAELVARASLLEYENEAKWKEVVGHRDSLEQQLQDKSTKHDALWESNTEMGTELQTLRKDLAKLEAAYTRSENLRAEIAFRGRALYAKDKIIAALRSEIEEWRDRLVGAYRQYHERCVTVSPEELQVKRSIKLSRCKSVPQS